MLIFSENRILPRRLRAVAILRFGTLDALHRRLPLCSRAITAQIHNRRLSEALIEALRAAIGDEAFAFVSGRSSILRDDTLPALLGIDRQITQGGER